MSTTSASRHIGNDPTDTWLFGHLPPGLWKVLRGMNVELTTCRHHTHHHSMVLPTTLFVCCIQHFPEAPHCSHGASHAAVFVNVIVVTLVFVSTIVVILVTWSRLCLC